ncbi:MAG: flagellar basal body rod protein FlgC [Rhodovulum sulfidophilum]|uniref:Flagellar basal body rod protein FlgB n=1 Tax=Rhodovulum sulfidophilum TaxID=35806 RepID=A0A2W5NJG0_RHOSU|nr:MAG: flagellar basal body rod protein FlgC [Rhodovulum sulfidophilum]
MDDLLRTLTTSASGMRAQATRVRLGAENIANADTPGYRRKTVSFEAAFARAGEPARVATGPVLLDQSDFASSFAPDNPLADKDGYVHGSNVDLIVEIADSREANRSYEANLRMFDQARQMASALLGLLRR